MKGHNRSERIRFSDLVKFAGHPHVATLWGQAEKDSAFTRAIRENRVLTVKQNPIGPKKDFGIIGFHKDKNVSYFIFPQPLPEHQNGQVVGIKYELLEKEKPIGAPVSARVKKQPRRKREPKENSFSVTIKRTAIIETALDIKAANKRSAEELALAQIREQPFDATDAVIQNQIRAIE